MQSGMEKRLLNDQEFIDRIQDKIEGLTGREIELRVDDDEPGQLGVDFSRPVPLVIMGRNVLEYSGFARLCTEYAVASIREQREIPEMEFQLLLARN